MPSHRSSRLRSSHITITGRSRIITIIAAHCLPIHSIESAGPLTSYFQQYHQLRQSGVISPDPRKRFYTDLTATPHELIHKHHDLVIMLDSNDDLSDSSPTYSLTHSLTTDCGLFSVHEYANYAADSPATATHVRGRKKIDHILVTAALLPAVTASGIHRTRTRRHTSTSIPHCSSARHSPLFPHPPHAS
jgi:hypothetical protein